MSYQAQVVINGTTIYHLMVRPGTLAIIGTTECKRITGTTCFNIYYWLNDTSIYHLMARPKHWLLLALQDAYVLL